VRSLYARSIDRLQLVADDVFAQQNGWDAVVALITGVAATTAAHLAIPQLTRRMVELEPELRHGAQWDADIERITHRAQQEGALRPDVGARDLTLAAFGIGYYVFLPPETRRRVIARQLAITLDGLRADSARTPLPGEGITTDEILGYYRHRIP
jgi:hypothetical protein